jgi:hypothetical protein
MSNRNGHHWIRDEKRARIYRRDARRCVWCGHRRRLLTLDHVVPRTHGGDNHHSNLVTACVTCNSRRRNLPAFAFAFALDRARGHVILERVADAVLRELPAP